MREHRDSGFTLIEVMVAVAVLGLMMLIAWGTVRRTIDARQFFGGVQERHREVRVAMNRMVHDFSSAYVSGNEDRTMMEPRTFFIAEASGDVDTVRFSAFAHTPLYADANESDQTVIAYYPESDPDDRSRTNLLRREVRRPQLGERWDSLPGETEVVFAGITKLDLTYWDVLNREWDDSWSTQNTDGMAPRLPERVRIALSFLDERGKEVTVVTEARIHIGEVLQFYAN